MDLTTIPDYDWLEKRTTRNNPWMHQSMRFVVVVVVVVVVVDVDLVAAAGEEGFVEEVLKDRDVDLSYEG